MPVIIAVRMAYQVERRCESQVALFLDKARVPHQGLSALDVLVTTERLAKTSVVINVHVLADDTASALNLCFDRITHVIGEAGGSGDTWTRTSLKWWYPADTVRPDDD